MMDENANRFLETHELAFDFIFVPRVKLNAFRKKFGRDPVDVTEFSQFEFDVQAAWFAEAQKKSDEKASKSQQHDRTFAKLPKLPVPVKSKVKPQFQQNKLMPPKFNLPQRRG